MRAEDVGKVITARGPVEPEQLGAVMMHEHLHSDWAQKAETPFDMAKWPILETYGVWALRELKKHGCHAFVDMTRAPERAAPWVYQKVSELAGFHLICATGFYREIKLGDYWAREPEDQIWPFVRESSVEELEEYCVREVEEGRYGTDLRAGVLKLGASSAELTEAEDKAARAVARAHKRTGVFINTHVQGKGAQKAQLDLLESEGVDPARVVLGHTMGHLVNEWPVTQACMTRGAAFALTNLRMDGPEAQRRAWADGIKRAFDEGLGDRVTLGLDWVFSVGYTELAANPAWRPHQGGSALLVPCTFMPPPPFVYLFTHTIPRFKEMGITEEMLNTMLVENPKRILPVKRP
ncbi:MAG: phosphotriesterase [Kiritimatiellae bacterium]|nr:phosphotriesterase [Kiritimatiellia bacterium]